MGTLLLVIVLLAFFSFGAMVLWTVIKTVGILFLEIVNPNWNNPKSKAPKKVTAERKREDLLNRSDGRGIL